MDTVELALFPEVEEMQEETGEEEETWKETREEEETWKETQEEEETWKETQEEEETRKETQEEEETRKETREDASPSSPSLSSPEYRLKASLVSSRSFFSPGTLFTSPYKYFLSLGLLSKPPHHPITVTFHLLFEDGYPVPHHPEDALLKPSSTELNHQNGFATETK